MLKLRRPVPSARTVEFCARPVPDTRTGQRTGRVPLSRPQEALWNNVTGHLPPLLAKHAVPPSDGSARAASVNTGT
jgi:hypothetical protein